MFCNYQDLTGHECPIDSELLYMTPNQENTLSQSVDGDCVEGDAQEPFHFLEDDEYRENEQIYCRKSNSSMADNESEIEHDEPEACIPL